MTERIFDQDVQCLTFTARVLSCEARGDAWAVVLDRTAFFPEGGGQGADHGTLGGARVTDAHDDHGVITHLTDAPLAVDSTVTGEVDAVRRLSMMQQHSGEHIFTGIVHRLYGYDNVGFHIGTDAVTVDFNGSLTEAQVREVERLANGVIWRDQPIHAWYPPREELESIEYRSKKAIDGDVRIVAIEGVDCCACCGTHVPTAGGVGQIKVMNVQKYKSGVRVSILCGMRALAAENEQLDENRAVSQALSAKPGTLAESVKHLLEERDQLRARCESLGLAAFQAAAKAETGRIRVLPADMLAPAQLRKAAGTLADGAEAAMVLLPREDGWSYALCSLTGDVRPMVKALSERFGGKGGGPKDMAQGVLSSGTPEEFRSLLEELSAQA